MGVLDTARQILAEIPLSDVQRERLDFAFDRLAFAETQISTLQNQVSTLQNQVSNLQAENERLQSQLQNVQLDRDEARKECQVLNDRIGKLTSSDTPKAIQPPSGLTDRMGRHFPERH